MCTCKTLIDPGYRPPPPPAATTATPTLSSLDEEGGPGPGPEGGGERTPSTPSVQSLSHHLRHERVIIVHKEVDGTEVTVQEPAGATPAQATSDGLR